MSKQITLYDTTLRDGTQGEYVNLSAEDKLRILKKLDDFGIEYVEGGWPGSNPKDARFFEMARKMAFQNTRLTAFGSTCRPGTNPQDDQNIKALLKTEVESVAIFGKNWDLHATEILKVSLSENLDMIRATVAYLKEEGLEVIYDAEHFFDGYKVNRAYAMEALKAAEEAGADAIVLCDTNGGSMPLEIQGIV
ncbi:MAG: citramalate synthase, partial [Desulfobacteraceae bacterium]|nr:citramalate synthase [Desulfobacteraceae bacterium]